VKCAEKVGIGGEKIVVRRWVPNEFKEARKDRIAMRFEGRENLASNRDPVGLELHNAHAGCIFVEDGEIRFNERPLENELVAIGSRAKRLDDWCSPVSPGLDWAKPGGTHLRGEDG
jgi:hypothetical protein